MKNSWTTNTRIFGLKELNAIILSAVIIFCCRQSQPKYFNFLSNFIIIMHFNWKQFSIHLDLLFYCSFYVCNVPRLHRIFAEYNFLIEKLFCKGSTISTWFWYNQDHLWINRNLQTLVFFNGLESWYRSKNLPKLYEKHKPVVFSLALPQTVIVTHSVSFWTRNSVIKEGMVNLNALATSDSW